MKDIFINVIILYTTYSLLVNDNFYKSIVNREIYLFILVIIAAIIILFTNLEALRKEINKKSKKRYMQLFSVVTTATFLLVCILRIIW
jgi:hypothetical protein